MVYFFIQIFFCSLYIPGSLLFECDQCDHVNFCLQILCYNAIVRNRWTPFMIFLPLNSWYNAAFLMRVKYINGRQLPLHIVFFTMYFYLRHWHFLRLAKKFTTVYQQYWNYQQYSASLKMIITCFNPRQEINTVKWVTVLSYYFDCNLCIFTSFCAKKRHTLHQHFVICFIKTRPMKKRSL